MEEKKQNINIWVKLSGAAILLFTVIYTTPFASYLTGRYFEIIGLSLVVVWIITSLLSNWSIKLTLYMVIVVVYILSFLVFGLLGMGDARDMIVGYSAFWFFAFFSEYLLQKKAFSLYGKIVDILMLIILITAITTIIASITYPNISKMTYVGLNKGRLNVGGFNFIYGIALLIPILIYNVFHKNKLPSLICLIGYAVCIFLSGYTLAFLGAGVGIFFSIFTGIKKKSNKVLFFIVMLILVMVLIFWGRIIAEGVIRLISGTNEHLASRLNEFLLLGSNEETQNTDMSSRLNLLSNSWRTFLSHPLLGVGPYYTSGASHGVGEHSQIFDDLARYGFISAVLLTVFIGKYLKYHVQGYEKSEGRAKIGGAIFVFLTISLFNPTILLPMLGCVLLFIIPGLKHSKYFS